MKTIVTLMLLGVLGTCFGGCDAQSKVIDHLQISRNYELVTTDTQSEVRPFHPTTQRTDAFLVNKNTQEAKALPTVGGRERSPVGMGTELLGSASEGLFFGPFVRQSNTNIDAGSPTVNSNANSTINP